MQYVINGCIAWQGDEIIKEGDDETRKVGSQPLTNDKVREKVGTRSSSHTRVNSYNNYDLSDYNIPTKKVGYLAMEGTDFRFVGPDRLTVTIDSVDKCLQVANIIKSTNLPNYRMVRIPVTSGLNIQSWERELQGYPDDRLLQYIKFGFPLSLTSSDSLHNQEVSNHFSARQYLQDIQKYLSKEISLGAMLGPVDSVNSRDLHCSPLMSHPKDGDSRRVIMDLSFPQGNALNDHLTKEIFDGTRFVLKLPSIEDIVKDIISTREDPVMFKVDVARAFRNLPVDPVDALKLGITWRINFIWISRRHSAGSLGWLCFNYCQIP